MLHYFLYLKLYIFQAAGQERSGPGRRPSHVKRTLSFTMKSGVSPIISIDAIANEEDEVCLFISYNRIHLKAQILNVPCHSKNYFNLQ